MKRFIIPFSIMLMLSGTAVYADDPITVRIDGDAVDFSEYDNVLPYIESGRTMMPIRAVAESLGAKVDWDADNEIVTIDDRIELEVNNDVAIVDGKQVIMDVPAEIRKSRTFVPLRFVSENMGAKVSWDNDTRTVKIFTPEDSKPETQTQTQTQTPAADPEKEGVFLNTVYMGVKGYGTQSANTKDYFVHRFFCDGSVIEYQVLRDDSYSLQNKLAEGYVYNVKVENGVITDIDEAAATVGVIDEVGSDTITLQGMNRAMKLPSVYKVTSSAGSVKVEKVTPKKGESIRIYSAETAYIGASDEFKPVVSGQAGTRTVKNFLTTAMEPVGHTLYVFGGGWNWQDNGASAQSTTIGVPQKWVEFFDKNDADYTYRTETGSETYYPHNGVNQYYYAGADCSGYIGWAVYNTLNTQSGGEGCVMASTQMAKTFADKGLGTWTQDVRLDSFKPGDIMSMNGHAWIYLGGCADGSAVIMHSTPSASVNGKEGGGVQLTALGSESSQAYTLVKQYMTKYFPEWSKRYTPTAKDANSYLSFSGETAGRFTWTALNDPDNYAGKDAEAILKDIFGE